MRAAIYARYSSDLQREASIEDQVRLCREGVVQMGGEVAGVYTDAAISGSHLQNRPGIQSLLDAARAHPCPFDLSLIHILRCRRSTLCTSRWSPYQYLMSPGAPSHYPFPLSSNQKFS